MNNLFSQRQRKAIKIETGGFYFLDIYLQTFGVATCEVLLVFVILLINIISSVFLDSTLIYVHIRLFCALIVNWKVIQLFVQLIPQTNLIALLSCQTNRIFRNQLQNDEKLRNKEFAV